MSRPEGDALAARNSSVIDGWNSGLTQRELSARHGITVIRVRQIMREGRSSITRVDTPNHSRSLHQDHHAMQLGFIRGTNHSSPHLAIQAGERTLKEWCEFVGSWRVA